MRQLLFLSVCALPLARDVDVAVPPGTPQEWTRELRTPTPSGYRGAVPTGGGVAAVGSTVAAERPADFSSSSDIGISRITTRDLPFEFKWSLPTKSVSDDWVPTPSSAAMWEYPPPLSHPQWWWITAVILRAGLHPSLVSEAECANLLIEVGEPASIVAGAVDGEKFCPGLTATLKREIPRMPVRRPTVPPMADPVNQMFAKLAIEELTGDHPHALNPYFARRLLALEDRAFPAVLACAKSNHTFLRHNAVSILAGYSSPEGLELLRKYAGDKDAVTRTRAVMALARRRDRLVVPELLSLLKDRDRGGLDRALALQALGLIGDPESAPAILDLARQNSKDGDLLFSALPALGRIRTGNEKFARELKKLVRTVESSKYDPAAFSPFLPPEPGMRQAILNEAGLLALAAQGDPDSVAASLDRAAWLPASQYLAVDVLSFLGEKGLEAVRGMASNARLELTVRAHAFNRLETLAPDAAFAKKLAQNGAVPSALRGLALACLSSIDPAAAREAGREAVQRYLAGDLSTPADAYFVMVAVQALGRSGDLDVEDLVKLVPLAAGQRRRIAQENARARGLSALERWTQEIVIVVDVPLLETVLIELGRTRSRKAEEPLAMILGDRRWEARAEAALALGAVGGARAREALLKALEDPEGWIRWSAYTALREMTGKDHFCDWMYGSGGERGAALKKWQEEEHAASAPADPAGPFVCARCGFRSRDSGFCCGVATMALEPPVWEKTFEEAQRRAAEERRVLIYVLLNGPGQMVSFQELIREPRVAAMASRAILFAEEAAEAGDRPARFGLSGGVAVLLCRESGKDPSVQGRIEGPPEAGALRRLIHDAVRRLASK